MMNIYAVELKVIRQETVVAACFTTLEAAQAEVARILGPCDVQHAGQSALGRNWQYQRIDAPGKAYDATITELSLDAPVSDKVLIQLGYREG